MKNLPKLIALAGVCLAATALQAQDVMPLSQEQALDFIKGKTHNTTRTAGGNPRLQFRDNGVVYGSNQGSNDSGKWKIEEGKLCLQWNRWEYQGCGALIKAGEEIRHLNPDGQSIHLVFNK